MIIYLLIISKKLCIVNFREIQIKMRESLINFLTLRINYEFYGY